MKNSKTKLKMLSAGLIFALSILGFACSSAPTPPPPENHQKAAPQNTNKGPSIEAKQAGAQIGSAHVAEIVFEKGKSEIRPSEAKKIEAGVAGATRAGEVKNIEIVAWSDSEMPAENMKELNKESVDLADARAKAIEEILKKRLPKVRTDRINMATRAGGLKKFLQTKDARIQDALEIAGAPKAGEKTVTEPKASRAILVFSGPTP